MNWDLERSILGAALSGLGCLAITLYVVVNGRARGKGALEHWGLGWALATLGMTLLGVGWGFLALAGPHLESWWIRGPGLLVGVASAVLYLLSARHVGRWKSPSRYDLGLHTSGIHAWVRHPQALALVLLGPGLALLSGSIPFLVSTPLWSAFWVVYTWLEERHELVPAFGHDYERYRRLVPALIPRPPRKRQTSLHRKRTTRGRGMVLSDP